MENMKTKELCYEDLMVGDWVMWKEKPVQVARVSGVVYSFGHIDVTLAHCNDSGLLETHDTKSISPIPITAEILEKNGWRGKSHTQWKFFRNGCDELNILLGKNYTQVEYLNMIYNPEDNAEVNYGHNFEFPRTIYVHELQHVLRLCGIEKEIEL